MLVINHTQTHLVKKKVLKKSIICTSDIVYHVMATDETIENGYRSSPNYWCDDSLGVYILNLKGLIFHKKDLGLFT